jgi:hypothetical protein
MVDTVKAALYVGAYNPPTHDQGLFHCQYRLLGAPLWAKAVGTVLKVGLKNRLDHNLARLLHHPVAYRRYPQRPLSTTDLGTRTRSTGCGLYFLAFRSCSICPRNPSTSLPFDVFDGLAIYPRTPTFPAYFFLGPPQHIGPEHAVIERMEPSVPAPLGRQL